MVFVVRGGSVKAVVSLSKHWQRSFPFVASLSNHERTLHAVTAFPILPFDKCLSPSLGQVGLGEWIKKIAFNRP